jgi:hypothetical protein
MWHPKFQDRLNSWIQLREKCNALSLPTCLNLLNQWWFHAPWAAYILHWDDKHNWPNPWQLLEEPRLCSLARGLGIIYTIAMLDRADIVDAGFFETDQDNLVQVNNKKYILNWDAGTIVNINPGTTKNTQHQLTLVEIQQLIG